MMKKIKKLMSLVMAICMMVTLMPGPVFGATTTTDYSTHWAKNAIEAAMKSGVSKGYPDGSFKPDNAITRAEFFALVNNTFGFTAVSTVAYTDVSADAWYAAEIAKAKAAGYISGYPDGGIHPNSNITRQEVAMIISRLKSLTAVSSTLSFTDAPSIADWSKKAVIAAFEAKMMSGYPDGSFQPTAPIKRAEALVAVKNSFAYQANTVKSTDIVYDKAGSYGSATETVTVEGNVVIKAAGVTLQNTIVKGNLTIAKEVGNGEVTLKSVIVKGNTYVNGGGVNSIYFVNVITGKVYVLKDDGPVRIVASGTSAIENIMAGSDVKLEEVNMTGKGFEGITVEKNAAGGIDITLVGVKCESVDIQAAGVTINGDKASTIATFTADVKTAVTGAVVIAKAVINASDVTFQTAPTATITAPGITEPTVTPAPAASSGGDGGGSGSSTQLSNLASLVAPGTQTLTATMENAEAAIAALSALVPTVAVTTNPAGTTTLPVVWTYSSFPDNDGAAYNPSTAATNVFTWTATLGTVTNTIPIALSGKVTVTNFTVALLPTAEKYFTFNAGTITGYDKAGGLDVVVPGWINGVAVTEIGQGALSYMEEAGLNSVVLPDGLLRIGRAAFSDSNLTSIIIPNSVTHIEGLALNCYDLKRLTIGSGVNIEDNLMSSYVDRNNNYFREAYLALGAGTYIGSTSTNEANGTWAKLGKVSEITVYGAGNATTLSAGGTLQMFANVVLLEDATDATITWSVTAGTATIGASTGLLTATGVGTVTVTATNVASGVTGTKDITVTAAIPLPSVDVAAQNGILYSTTDGTATFAVTTMLIQDGEEGEISYFGSDGNASDQPAAIDIICSDVSSNSATITASGQHAAPETYYFKVTIDGVTSSLVELTVTQGVQVSAITVTGNAVVGATLTAAPTPGVATGTYQWTVSDTVGGTYTNIALATNATYTLLAGDAGKFIKVIFTASGSYTGTQTSAATAAIVVQDKVALTAAITAEVGAVHGIPVYVLTEANYTVGSWATYTGAITTAITAEGNAAATQLAIDNATTAIGAAKATLVTLVSELATAKTGAKAAADALLTGLTAGDYTAASWLALTDTIAADKLAIDAFTTVSEVTSYTLTGTAAKAALVIEVAIGDNYQGGIVAYILDVNDPGYVAGQVHGLIAATDDQSAEIVWAYGQHITVLTGTLSTLGSGAANTDKIIAYNTAGITYAAGLARACTDGGYADWYLPSKDELNQLYLNRTAVGGFASGYYWSSTLYDQNPYNNAWIQNLEDGAQNADYIYSTSRVRAVRSF